MSYDEKTKNFDPNSKLKLKLTLSVTGPQLLDGL